jgi:DNA modification methylase
LLLHGDCLDLLQTLDADSIDAIVTDPPYGLSFMGKRWDYDVPSEGIWRECLRVLKPGGHLLAFAGTRTQHRMAVRIEDAGFEIRDMIAWVYGSGFPKSLDVSKAIDKMGGVHPNWQPEQYERAVEASGFTHADVDRHLGLKASSCYWSRTDHRRCTPLYEHWLKARNFLGLDDNFASVAGQVEREVIGHRDMGFAPGTSAVYGEYSGDTRITAPATDAAREWQGWGTALKPALEPITVARKPLEGTVAANVMAYGTGGLNIDGCRVAGEPVPVFATSGGQKFDITTHNQNVRRVGTSDAGRWPANLIHDGSEEVLAGFPSETNRFFYVPKASKKDRDEGLGGGGGWSKDADKNPNLPRANVHPTVKPTDLMRYLCRLVTPPGGTVLDPFMGSGSTGKAARLEGFQFIGIERDADYFQIAQRRISQAAVQERLAV